MAQTLKVHQVCTVAPPQEAAATSLPFTFFDTLWLRLPPVERLFFYDHPNSTTSFFDSVLPTLKHSLSITLQHFLPLAGTITWPLDSPHPIITYLPGDAVPLTVAESAADFNQLSSNLCEAQKRHPLIPPLKTSHEKASVMSLQLTLFPDAGFSIGITTHHAALDGKTSTSFMKAWASVCSNLKVKDQNPCYSLPENLTPFFDRSVITDPSGINEVYANSWLNFGGETNNRSLKVWETLGGAIGEDTVKGLFEVTPSHIKKLKQYAESKIDKNKVRLSSFSVTCAYLISCVVKVEQVKSKRVAFVFSVDCRTRLEPPIKPTYFGNCIMPHLAVAETGEVLGDDGFINALVVISDELSELESGVMNGAEDWISKIQSVAGDKMFSTAGSPRFEVYGVDFGWGRPKKVDVTSVDRTGAFSLSDSRDIHGGIEIGLALNKSQMEAFAEVFAKGLESL
ncbi:phenolic glucoside malonyltransferase 1-like [Lotus japonicus]|uniref:phenolic glucoside malonyltransferase 1-like n=1 Tax=Lotus japonicus TaxID=34305 RepID=UPI00258676A8|nr:phenolic glucoside malonyltransferase 1-like [Lotus japonicus]